MKNPTPFRVLSAIALVLMVLGFSPWFSKTTSSPLLVAWDVSASMAETDGISTSRWTVAQRLWQNAKTNGISVAVGEKAVFGEHQKFTPTAPTFSLDALTNILRSTPTADAVLLFSDGRMDNNDVPLPNVPVFAVGVGIPEGNPDVVVENLHAPSLAFPHWPTEVTARLVLHGPPQEKNAVSVGLFQGTTPLAEKTIFFSSGTAEVSFSFTPSRPGLAVYDVRAVPLDGERSLQNNRRGFAVDVQRERVRVLYISGRPGPHYGFLRAQLKNDPSVDLVSFVILRDPTDVLGYSEREMSLIPFPSPLELSQQLKTFDAVILEDPVGARVGLGFSFYQALTPWVRAGGGLLVISPPELTPLDKNLSALLPWLEGDPVPGPDRFFVTPKDPSHPLLALNNDAAQNLVRWKNLSVLEGEGLWPPGVRADAHVLLKESKTGNSVMATRSVGQGRVLGLSEDTDWRWALGAGQGGDGPGDYQKFWENTVHWLVATPGAGPVRLSRSQTSVRVGETFPVSVFTPPEMKGLPQLTFRKLNGKKNSIPMTRGTKAGEFFGTHTFEEPGSYEIHAQGGSAWQDHYWINVSPRWDETFNLTPDFDRLKEIALKTGGAFVSAQDFNEAWLRRQRAQHKTPSPPSRTVPYLMATVALIFLTIEWILLRHRGRL